jgi:RNA polymerase sigma-70 factor (ECF subfamily)
LLQRMKRGDSTALRILFERYFVPLCRFASRFLHAVDLSEEAVSDVFLNVWLKRETIEIRTMIKTYLYVAVRNQSLNYIKKNNPYLKDIEFADWEGIISDERADGLIQYEEFKEGIESVIRQLPEQRQMIFRMNRLDGLSYKEIAEILSISVNTVQNQMVQAVKFLSNRYPRHKYPPI